MTKHIGIDSDFNLNVLESIMSISPHRCSSYSRFSMVLPSTNMKKTLLLLNGIVLDYDLITHFPLTKPCLERYDRTEL